LPKSPTDSQQSTLKAARCRATRDIISGFLAIGADQDESVAQTAFALAPTQARFFRSAIDQLESRVGFMAARGTTRD